MPDSVAASLQRATRRRARPAQRLSITLEHVDLRRASRWVLRDLSLRLEPGRHYALLGGNGAGKTQFLKLLATDVWPTPTGRERVRFALGPRVIAPADAKRRIVYVGAERQDKYARYGWNPSVRELLATGLHGTDLLFAAPTAHESRRIERALRGAGIARLGGRKFLSLSYGQKRIALLARALIGDPDWLLLDEIYNGLDAAYRRRLDRLLDAARRRGRSWIAAAHRAADVPRGTSRLLRLHAGRLEHVGAFARETARSLARDARELARDAGGRRRGDARGARRRGEVLLTLRDVDLYVDYRCVLRAVRWELRRGEHWAIVGANGSGKTSFLKLLHGDLAPALGGCIERAGCPPGTAIADWKRRVGYVSPELQTDCEAGAGPAGFSRRRPRELSYGQLRRALLERALALEPELLLLDEPLTGLDPRARAAVKRRLDALARAGTTIVIAVHHPEDLPACVTRVLRLGSRRAIAAHTMPTARDPARTSSGDPTCR